MEADYLGNLRGGSLDRVELIRAIEEFSGDYIPPDDERKLRRLKTVQEAIEYIQKRKKGGDLN